ncbi:MAG: 16S rRNA (guanine(966)-N(2))-methyltransferase RsmD [Lachnospiraceae bacterium]|nr:16S rRNA (guanine(966)-N(2))-methyltransferase RsmD [Lachnospiraceae bacterium]
MLRVIAGEARSIPLKTLDGLDTRPTTDRVKETLFNLLQNYIYDCRFLDLFAGSGQIGIEALSRGAREAVFVEKNKKACDIIEQNLTKTKLIENACVLKKDVISALPFLGSEFDIIFMDPPYALGVEKEVLASIKEHSVLAEDGQIIIEADLNRDFSFVTDMGYEIIKEKIYKTNKHVFLRS